MYRRQASGLIPRRRDVTKLPGQLPDESRLLVYVASWWSRRQDCSEFLRLVSRDEERSMSRRLAHVATRWPWSVFSKLDSIATCSTGRTKVYLWTSLWVLSQERVNCLATYDYATLLLIDLCTHIYVHAILRKTIKNAYCLWCYNEVMTARFKRLYAGAETEQLQHQVRGATLQHWRLAKGDKLKASVASTTCTRPDCLSGRSLYDGL